MWSELKTDSVLFVFIMLSDSLLSSNVVKYLTNVYHATTGTVHGPGLPWALGAGQCTVVHSLQTEAQFNHTGVQLPGRLPDQFPKV